MFLLIKKLYVSKFFLVVFCFVSSFTVSLGVKASPWIEVGDDRLRNNLQLLNDSGVMPISLTTWPVMWADVKNGLTKVERSQLNAAQASAVRELEFELRYQTRQGPKRSVEVVAASSRVLFRDFGAYQREKGELHKSLEWNGESIAIKLQANVVTDPGDDAVQTYFDGSYVAGVLGGQSGGWVLGVGAIDRWWGGGSQSSLILSNNARPVPALMLRTKQSQGFETPLLSWLGEWQFVSFLGQMESNRTIPEAKLTGMRFTFKPFNNLELGLSRAMQWGGEGRGESLNSFWKSLTSQGENEGGDSGNQLAGFDARFSYALTDKLSGALYAQTIGEDEAGYMPARRTHQLGFDFAQSLDEGDFLKFNLEYTNTTADAFKDVIPNITYEHSVYTGGYRYRGRSLGASFDNDSEVLSLAGAFQQSDGKLSELSLSYMKLNEDGVASGNTVSASAQSLYVIQANHQQFFCGGRLKVGISYQSEVLETLYEDVDQTSVFASWEYRFK